MEGQPARPGWHSRSFSAKPALQDMRWRGIGRKAGNYEITIAVGSIFLLKKRDGWTGPNCASFWLGRYLNCWYFVKFLISLQRSCSECEEGTVYRVVSPMAAGHAGVSITDERRSPNKKKSKSNTNVCLPLWLKYSVGEGRKETTAPPLSCRVVKKKDPATL